MARRPILRMRVDLEMEARVKAIVAAHNAQIEPGAPEWDQGDVLRILIMRSLPGLEAEQGVNRSAPPAASPEPTPAAATPAKATAKKTTKTAK